MAEDQSARLTRLEQENAQLKHEAAQRRIADPRPLVRPMPVAPPIEMPNRAQMIEISRVVIGICPWLSSASTYMDTAEWDRQYFAAFAALAHINRCDTPDTRWLLPHWTGRLETIARALGHFAQITGAPMTAAILGIGDVPHDVGVVSHMTRTASFGLVDGSGRAPNAAGWKRVLETSQALGAVDRQEVGTAETCRSRTAGPTIGHLHGNALKGAAASLATPPGRAISCGCSRRRPLAKGAARAPYHLRAAFRVPSDKIVRRAGASFADDHLEVTP